MDVHKLDRIFTPQRIALVGVTANPKSVGGKVLSNLVSGGFRGVVYPVNPSLEAVMGIQCFPGVRHLPRTADLAVICAPAPQVPDIVRECGEAGILEIAIDWGVKKFTAVTTSDNHRMLAVFRKRDFSVSPDPESPLVEVSKDL